MIIYCANDPCEVEAMYATESGMPLCHTCHEAYTMGLAASREATTYEIERLHDYRIYLRRDPGRLALPFRDFAPLIEELDHLAHFAEQDQTLWPPEQKALVNVRLPQLENLLSFKRSER